MLLLRAVGLRARIHRALYGSACLSASFERSNPALGFDASRPGSGSIACIYGSSSMFVFQTLADQHAPLAGRQCNQGRACRGESRSSSGDCEGRCCSA